MLDATRLRVLVAVARYGSVTGAAQALNYAQPSISHHIARLEAETGAKLMERSGRGVKLTEAGQLLADRAEEIIGRLDAAEAELATHVGLRQDRVRLAAFGSALSTLVATASAALHASHTDTGVQLVQADPTEALRMLRAREVDVALVYRLFRDGEAVESPAAEPRTSWSDTYPEAKPVLDEPIFLITAQADSETSAPPTGTLSDPQPDLTAHDFAPATMSESATRAAILAAHSGERWISTGEQCDELLVDLCRDAGFSPDLALRTGDFVAAQSLVAAGLGVTVMPGLALRAARHPRIQATLLPGACRQILAVTYEPAPDSPAARRLIDAIATSKMTAPPAAPAPTVPKQVSTTSAGNAS
ncbi:MAG TPA: LysR family transcriptional regulator [Streptosporangiaceae bacterium]|jgi:DNA-binding transcriptional LysR family regulator